MKLKKLKFMLPYIGVLLANFYILPVLITSNGLGMVMLLIIIPLISFATSVVYGFKRSFYWLYPVAVAILFIPTIYIYYNSSAWFYVAAYGIIALIGSMIGKLLSKRE